MVEIQRKVQGLREGITVPENSQVGESAANGRVENAIQRVQRQCRTLKDDLENKLKKKIMPDHPIYLWLVE